MDVCMFDPLRLKDAGHVLSLNVIRALTGHLKCLKGTVIDLKKKTLHNNNNAVRAKL